MGNVIQPVDLSEYKEHIKDINEYIKEEQRQAEELSESASFNLVYMAKKYDDWFLDPLVGFLIPGVGDLISSLTILPAIYVAIFKLHSLKLTIAIMTTALLDLLVGWIPVLGDIVDAFYKSNKIAARLIVGYVEDDPETMSEINKRATTGVLILAAVGFLLYVAYNLVMSLYHWIVGLFA